MIPQDFITELLSRVDVVDTIELRVPLKKKGSEYAACCPFHGEKTPSFYVSPSKQFYHCFGCGAHGTAINFLMEYENLSFPEAIEHLADMAGLEVPRSANVQRKVYDHSAIGILNHAAEIYANSLRQLPADHEVKTYLKNRGLSDDIINTYQIGYASSSIQALKQSLECDDAALLRSGLLSEGDTGNYARFRDRIMFPIRNRRGDVIGFGGRAVGDTMPKYLNSAETEFFHKGEELYGLYEARKSSPRLEHLLVVEGYMDVVALAQFGLTQAVATLGTATTPDHAFLLSKRVRQITFCFDGDNAGRKAAWKALENMLPAMREGLSAGFLFLPEGEDPDSLVRSEGVEAFTARMKKSTKLLDFIIKQLHEIYDIDTIDGRANALTEAIPLLAKLPDGSHFDALSTEIATLTRQHENVIKQRVASHRKMLANREQRHDAPTSHQPTRRPLVSRSEQMDVAKTPLRRAIALLLCAPHLSQATVVQSARIRLPKPNNDPYFELLHHLLEILDNNPKSNTAMIIAQVENPQMQQALSKLASWRPIISDELLIKDLVDALSQLTKRYNPQKSLLEKIQQGIPLSEDEKNQLRKQSGQ